MTTKQRESAAKFLFDLSKGVALLTVVSPWVTNQGSWIIRVLGIVGAGLVVSLGILA